MKIAIKILSALPLWVITISGCVAADLGKIDKIKKNVPEMFSYERFKVPGMQVMPPDSPPCRWLDGELQNLLPKGDYSIEWRKEKLVLANKGAINSFIQLEIQGIKRGDLHQLIWSRAVYMIFSSRSTTEINDLIARLKNEQISEKEFVDIYMKIEFCRVKQMVDFYKKTWRPWAIDNGAVPINHRYWHTQADLRSYNHWLSQQNDNGNVKVVKLWAKSFTEEGRR